MRDKHRRPQRAAAYLSAWFSRRLLVALVLLAVMVVPTALAAGGSQPAGSKNDPYDLAHNPEVRTALEKQRHEVERRRAFRASAAGRRARSDSRDAYRHSSGHDSIQLAHDSFGPAIDEPPLHGLGLRDDEHLVQYVGDSGAIIARDGGGQTALMRSTFPLRSEKDGHLAPTDLRLEETAGGFETANAPLAVEVGADLSDGVRLPGLATLVPLQPAPGATGRLVSGKAFFADAAADTDLWVAPQPGGAEVFTQVRSPEAPEVQAYDVHMPDGATLRMSDDVAGAAEIVRDGKPIGSIAPPVAADADGEPVPMSYRVQGDRLYVKVAHRDGDFRYPILADPLISDTTFNSPPPSGQALPATVNGWGRKINPPTGTPGWGFDYRDGSPFGRATWGTGLWIWDWPGGAYATGNSGEWLFEWNTSRANSSYIARLDAYGANFDPRLISGVSYTCQFFGMWSDYRNNWDGNTFKCGSQPSYNATVWGGPSANYTEGTAGNHATMAIWTSGNSYQGSQTVAQVDRMVVYLSDAENPTTTLSHSVSPTTWGDNESRTVSVSGQDSGLGTKRFEVRVPSTAAAQQASVGCSGLGGSECPTSTQTSTFGYSLGGLPEGTGTSGQAQVFDAGDKFSTATWGLKVDHSNPVIDTPSGAASVNGAWLSDGPQPLTAPSHDDFSGLKTSTIFVGPMALVSDSFTRTTSGGWGTADTGGPWSVLAGPAADYATNGSTAQVALAPAADHVISTRSGVAARDQDAAVDITFPALQASGITTGSLLLRRNNTTGDGYRVALLRDQNGTLWIRSQTTSGSTVFADVNTGLVATPGQPYRLRVRVNGASPTTVQAKAWRVGTNPPAAWMVSASDSTLGPQVSGEIAVGAWQNMPASATVGMDNFSFSDLAWRTRDTRSNTKAGGGTCDAASGCANTMSHSYTWNPANELEGPHAIAVRVNDALGHTPADRSWTVNVDNQAPIATAGPTGNLWTNNGKFIRNLNRRWDLHASVADTPEGSGISEVRILMTYNGTTTELDAANATQNCTPQCPTSVSRDLNGWDANSISYEGPVRFTMVAKDRVGHSTTIADTTVKLDKNAPNLGPYGGDLAKPAGGTVRWVGPGSHTLTHTPTDSYSGVKKDNVGFGVLAGSDAFARTVASGWGTADRGGAWQNVYNTGGSTSVNGSAATMTLPQNAIQYMQLATPSVRDADLSVRVRFPGLTPGTDPNGPAVAAGLTMRRHTCSTNTTGDACHIRILAVVRGDGHIILRGVTGGNTLFSDRDTGLIYNSADAYNLRTRVVGTAPTLLYAKLWKDGNAEPAGWGVVGYGADFLTIPEETAGGIGLRAVAQYSTPTTVLFDKYTVDEIAPSSSYAPTCDVTTGCPLTAPQQVSPGDGTNADEGVHRIVVWASDAVDQAVLDEWNVKLDRSNPSTSNRTGSMSQSNGTIGLGLQTLGIDTADSLSGVAHAQLLVNGNLYAEQDTTCTAGQCPTSKHFDFNWDSSDSQGRVTFTVRVIDQAGNKYDDTWTMAVDSDNPTIVSRSGNLAPISGAVPWVAEDQGTLTVNSHDVESGIQKSEVSLTPNAIGNDSWSRTTTNGWGSADKGGAWSLVQGVASSFSSDGSRGLITVPSTPQAIKLGTLSSHDAEARVDITFPAPAATSGEEIGYVLLRRVSAHSYTVGLVRDSQGRISIRALDGSGAVVAPDVATGLSDLAGGTPFRFRLRTTGASPTLVRAKVWKVGDREPTAWNMSASDGSVGPQGSGDVLLQGVETTPKPSSVIAFDNFATSDLAGGVRDTKIGLNSSGNACTAADCPNDMTHTFNWTSGADVEGLHTISAKVYDAASHTAQTTPWTVGLDRTPPSIALSGSLKDQEGKPVFDGTYNLHVDARDGDSSAPELQNSGVKTLKIEVVGTTGTVTAVDESQACPLGNCGRQRDWEFRASDWAPGPYTIRVTSADQVATGSATAAHTGTASFNIVVTTVPLGTPDKLGLEDYFQYRSVETGGGTRAHVNLANGNMVWHSVPIVNPGRGLSSFVNLTYNSQSRLEDGAQFDHPLRYKQAGLGFSLGISGITRVNEPLDVSMATAGLITLTDPDGTRHRFRSHDLLESYDAPPGVNLYLRRYSGVIGPEPIGITDPARTWAATRPDGTTYFFDQGGWPTTIEDRNGNKLTYNYECIDPTNGTIQAVCDVQGLLDPAGNPLQLRRLKSVTDAAATGPDDASRSISFGYDTNNVADNEIVGHLLTGHVKTITDHDGRVTTLGYDGDYLTSLTQATGAGTEGGERSFGFEYEDADLAHALDERYLHKVTDPRGAVTRFEYEPKELVDTNPRKLLDVFDRRSPAGDTHFAYRDNGEDDCDATTCTDVTDPLGHTSNNKLDARGRLQEMTDARGARTEVGWDDEAGDDNNVIHITEAANDPAQRADQSMTYDSNGLLLTASDPNHHCTRLDYNEGNGTFISPRLWTHDNEKTFVGDLISITTPKGTGADCETWSQGSTAFKTRFVLDTEDKGNVLQQINALGDVADTQYVRNSDGTIANGNIDYEVDWHKPAEVGNKTSYSAYDGNGDPQIMVDARGNEAGGVASDHRWIMKHDGVGNLTSLTDPRGAKTGDETTARSTFTTTLVYDKLDRLTRETRPKDSVNGESVSRDTHYDANGNVDWREDFEGARTTSHYTPMDELDEVDSPPTAHRTDALDPEVTRMTYDAGGNVTDEYAPMSATNGTPGAFSTHYQYDVVDQVVAAIRRQRGNPTPGEQDKDLVTSYDHDLRGNVIGIADAKRNAAAGGAVNAAQNATQPAHRRFTYTYDLANRRSTQVEDPSGFAYTTKYNYDDNDNVHTVVDPRGVADPAHAGDYTTTYDYDDADRRIDSIDPNGDRTDWNLRADGRPLAVTKPNGTAAGCDGKVSLSCLYQTKYDYYATGELKSFTLPRAAQQYGPSVQKWSFDRDAAGNPEHITDARGHTFDNTFYDTGEVKTTERPSYWNVGKGDPEDGGLAVSEPSPDDLMSSSGGDGTDGAKNPQGEGDFGPTGAQDLPDLLAKSGHTAFRYDKDMRLKTVTAADAGQGTATSTISYDQLGRTRAVEQPLDASADSFITTRFRYDRNGNLAVQTDGKDAATTLVYDQFDRQTEVHAPAPSADPDAEAVTKLTYDANDNRVTRRTPRGNVWKSGYDMVDRIISREDPLHHATTYDEYDAAGNVLTKTSPRGNSRSSSDPPLAKFQTKISYDGANQTKTMTDGLGNLTSYGYDHDGNRTHIEEPGAKASSGGSVTPQVTERSFDGRDLPWTEQTGSGASQRATVTEFDGNGNLRRKVSPAGVDTSGSQPRPSLADDAPQRTSAGSTADQGNQALKDATKNATVYEYSDDDVLTATHLPWGATRLGDSSVGNDTRRFRRDFDLDQRGRTKSITAPYDWTDPGADSSAHTSYTYFDTDWIRTATQHPNESFDDSKFEYEYDKQGNQTKWCTERSGSHPGCSGSDTWRVIQRDYFPSGDLKSRDANVIASPEDERTYSYEYNPDGQLTHLHGTNPSRTHDMSYDDAGRNQSVTVTGGPSKDTQFDYDADDNVKTRRTDGTIGSDGSYTGGKTTTFELDPLGREQSMTVTESGEDTRSTQTDYYPSGQRERRTQWKGVVGSSRRSVSEYYYGNDGRLAHRDRRQADLSIDSADSHDYTYDANGNRTHSERGDYRFNARDQLTYWKRNNGKVVTYDLKGSGAIQKKVDDGVTTSFDYYANSDRLRSTTTSGNPDPTHYCYDDNGDIKRISIEDCPDQAGATAITYKFDAFNRMTRSTGTGTSNDASYSYDGLDRREAKCTGSSTAADDVAACTGGKRTTYSYIGTSEKLSLEQDSDGGSSSPSGSRSYDYASNGERIGIEKKATSAPTGTYRSYSKDANGSVEGLEGDDGSMPASMQYHYDPYGQQEGDGSGTSADAQDNPFRFQDFYFDSGVKTYDMQARAYRPEVGRFLSEDRYESSSGDFNLEADALTQDRYAFAGGNPINRIEFDGHRLDASDCRTQSCRQNIAEQNRAGNNARARRQSRGGGSSGGGGSSSSGGSGSGGSSGGGSHGSGGGGGGTPRLAAPAMNGVVAPGVTTPYSQPSENVFSPRFVPGARFLEGQYYLEQPKGDAGDRFGGELSGLISGATFGVVHPTIGDPDTEGYQKGHELGGIASVLVPTGAALKAPKLIGKGMKAFREWRAGAKGEEAGRDLEVFGKVFNAARAGMGRVDVQTKYNLTFHAAFRLKQRGITPAQVDYALRNGQPYWDHLHHNMTYFLPQAFASGKSLRVAYDPLSHQVKTVVRQNPSHLNPQRFEPLR